VKRRIEARWLKLDGQFPFSLPFFSPRPPSYPYCGKRARTAITPGTVCLLEDGTTLFFFFPPPLPPSFHSPLSWGGSATNKTSCTRSGMPQAQVDLLLTGNFFFFSPLPFLFFHPAGPGPSRPGCSRVRSRRTCPGARTGNHSLFFSLFSVLFPRVSIHAGQQRAVKCNRRYRGRATTASGGIFFLFLFSPVVPGGSVGGPTFGVSRCRWRRLKT